MNKPFFIHRLTRRSFAVLLVHIATFVFSFWLAYNLRFDFAVPHSEWVIFFISLPAVVIIKSTIFYASGHCHQSWQYVTFSDLAALFRSVTLSALVIVTLDHFGGRSYHIPRTIMFIDWATTLLLLGAVRAAWRFSREEFKPLFYARTARRALIVGANPSAEMLARHLAVNHRMNYRVVGYLDSDRSRHESTLGGVPVLGDWKNTAFYAAGLEVQDVLVISDVLTGPQLRELMELCQQAELLLKVIPAMDDLLNTNYVPQIRDVEINDLLRREPVQLNSEAISKLIEQRTVMVTGAGGSIGSEICRQILKFQPKKLLLVEQAENSLFFIEQELLRSHPQAAVVPCIADITDADRIRQVFSAHRPDIVFHAAAHKHVPMMEHNPGEAIKNNVLGTRQLADLAEAFGVHEFVMISTDKAVNPTSVMGVSKHLAERYIHALSEVAKTKFVVVRFGNVLASNGSVVPIFQEQIRRGGPITVTHPDIERYFMTIPEASQLVLQAAAMGKGGEIFVLDMGESVRIVDLARDLIRLSGLQPDDVEIVFTGLRPGEKLYEELYFDEEAMLPTPHPKVFVAYHRPFQLAPVQEATQALAELLHREPDVLKAKLKELVPEYQLSGGSEACSKKPTRKPDAPSPNGAQGPTSPNPISATVAGRTNA